MTARHLTLWLAVVVGVSASAALSAEDEFGAIDTDGNGTISESEAQAAGRRLFVRLDRNGDGKLSGDEVGARFSAPVFKAADPDADGTLNVEEYGALVTARFKSANANGDGLVDREEFGGLAGALLRMVTSERVSMP